MKVASTSSLWRLLGRSLLALACACDVPRDVNFSAANALGSAAGEPELAEPATAGMLQLMERAHANTLYQGLRRVRLVHSVRGKDLELIYREDVACDGNGNFNIQCLEVLGDGLGADDEELFVQLQSAREGLVHRYRDFRIRNLRTFQESYVLQLCGEERTIAGISCEQIRVQRKEAPTFYYLAWVDPRTGLVLGWRQCTLDHQTLAEVEFESLNYAPDLAGRELRGEHVAGVVLDLARELSLQVEFAILVPQMLPSGYRLAEAVTFTDVNGSRWLSRVYSDGCEALVLLHTAPAPSLEAQRAAYLDVVESGSLVLMAGEVEGAKLIAAGRVSYEDLRICLQSALLVD